MVALFQAVLILRGTMDYFTNTVFAPKRHTSTGGLSELSELHAEVPPESFPLGAGPRPLPRPDFFGRRQRKPDPICELPRMTFAIRRICWSASGRVEQVQSWLITAVALAKNRCSIKQLNVDRV